MLDYNRLGGEYDSHVLTRATNYPFSTLYFNVGNIFPNVLRWVIGFRILDGMMVNFEKRFKKLLAHEFPMY